MNELYHPFKQLCEQRKSLRDFANQAVSPEEINKIKHIAATAPYASGRKNWDIVVIDDKATIQAMVDIVTHKSNEYRCKLKESFVEGFEAYAAHFLSFARAPVLFIPVFRVATGLAYMLTTPDEQIIQWERDSYVKSISGVALLILLAAESLGLGGCYMTGPLLAEAELKKLLNIKKDRHLGAIIPVGYAVKSEK